MKKLHRTPIYLGIVLVLAGLIGCASPLNPPQENYAPLTGEWVEVNRGVVNAIPIGSAADLAQIGGAYSLDGDYVLTQSITLTNWIPIGDERAPFTGTFNGSGYTIALQSFDSNALANNPYIGFFGYVKGASPTSKAGLGNVIIDADGLSGTTTITAGQAVGLLAGYTENTEIFGITTTGKFFYNAPCDIYVGGVVGYAYSGTVIRNSAAGAVINVDGGNGGGLSPNMFYNFVGGVVGLFEGLGTVGVEILNCHNTGAISAVCTTANAQVFCGGIAGGSYYQFTVNYQGSIQDSYSTGDILAQCPGFWSWAGGIAGCTVGDGDGKGPATVTRIERCYATGTVSVAGTTAGFPYVGGIVAYNYYGALISQCWFNGTVLSDHGSDYAGGIAGYNSRFEDHNSRIEDCWSYGLVQGLNNAGGIVGQNQVDTYVQRCYSRARVAVTNTSPGVGGIAGLNASELEGSITGCVALNASLTAANGSYIQRVVGALGRDATLGDNYGWEDMPISGAYTSAVGLHDLDGADCVEQPPQTLYEDDLHWDFDDVWEWDSVADYPRLQWQIGPLPLPSPKVPASI
jgi:hypothetical protein